MVELSKPIVLRDDNFTSLRRTPWAGKKIVSRYKRPGAGLNSGLRVGEAWEFSCDPQFPSRAKHGDQTLTAIIESDPAAALGETASRQSRGAGCEILVKLLSADQPLSLQIHPADGDPHLQAGECGKPESWWVLDAEPGAGLFLGFSQAMTRDALRNHLVDSSGSNEWLQFVAVKPGDYFEIEAGVPHAIGKGVTLLEPQRILFGQSGKTYRLWDWGRKYNPAGELDLVKGAPRELHVEAGLRLCDPERQFGLSFVDSLRRDPLKESAGGIEWSAFPANPHYQLHVLTTSNTASKATLALKDGYAAGVVLSGSVRLGEEDLGLGEPVFLPQACFPLNLQLSNEAQLGLVIPSTGSLILA